MFKDLISLQDKTIPVNVKQWSKNAIGFHDVVGLGEGSDARLYVSTVDNWPHHPPSIIEIDPENIKTTIPELVEELDTDVTILTTDGKCLYAYESCDESICSFTPWDDDLYYITSGCDTWSGMAVFEGILYATRSGHDGKIIRCDDSNNEFLDNTVGVMYDGFTADWVGTAVCDGKLYALSSLLNLYVFNKDQDKFDWFCCLHEATELGNGYQKIKGIGKYLYLIDRFWHLWRYDPMDPKSMTNISEGLNNISSICELNGKMYVTQISGSIYEYIPHDLTDE